MMNNSLKQDCILKRFELKKETQPILGEQNLDT